jgi:ribosomal protein L21
MAVVLTTRDQEFLARSNSTIAAMDQSKVKNKTIEADSSKQYKASKQRQGHRWAV